MRKLICTGMGLFMMVLFVTLDDQYPIQAAAGLSTYLNDNRNAQDYTSENWSSRIYNYLVRTDNGYMRVHLKQNGTAYV